MPVRYPHKESNMFESMSSKDLCRSIQAVRELDCILRDLKDYIHHECVSYLQVSDGPITVLCAYADEMEDENMECQSEFGMSPDTLRLRISEILAKDMAPEAEEELQNVTGPTTLRDVAETWTNILWKRTKRCVDKDKDDKGGFVHKHF